MSDTSILWQVFLETVSWLIYSKTNGGSTTVEDFAVLQWRSDL